MNLGAELVVSVTLSAYSDSRITQIRMGVLSSQLLTTLNGNVCAVSYSSILGFLPPIILWFYMKIKPNCHSL